MMLLCKHCDNFFNPNKCLRKDVYSLVDGDPIVMLCRDERGGYYQHGVQVLSWQYAANYNGPCGRDALHFTPRRDE